MEYLSASHSVKSIVQSSIAGAVAGEFGNVHASSRTAGSEMFINPLMSTYWTFDLATVARMMGFRDRLRTTTSFIEVEAATRLHHAGATKRDWTPLPY